MDKRPEELTSEEIRAKNVEIFENATEEQQDKLLKEAERIHKMTEEEVEAELERIRASRA